MGTVLGVIGLGLLPTIFPAGIVMLGSSAGIFGLIGHAIGAF